MSIYLITGILYTVDWYVGEKLQRQHVEQAIHYIVENYRLNYRFNKKSCFYGARIIRPSFSESGAGMCTLAPDWIKGVQFIR